MKQVSLLILLISSLCHGEAKVIRVGGYSFSPFVELSESGQASGVTIDMIEALNKSQSKYNFVFVKTSPVDRYKDFNDGRFDLIFFEDPKWGWKNYDVFSSKVFLKGGEVYITSMAEGKDQSYFDSFKGKRLIGIEGYHYALAGFNSHKETLRSKFNMSLTDAPWNLIRAIIGGDADVAIVTKSYLMKALLTRPNMKKKILISLKMDQEYHHKILARKNGPLTEEQVNAFLIDFERKGLAQQLWWQYGISN